MPAGSRNRAPQKTEFGAGRASTFPALVPIFGLILGFLTLGVVPTILQLIGLVIVVIGFRFVVR